jgi:hypothetical protein
MKPDTGEQNKKDRRFDAKMKRAQRFIKDKTKGRRLIMEHLDPCRDDLILLTLKGHLIIEDLLESILMRELDLEGLPQSHPLEFSQKLDLVKAVVITREPKPNADLFCAIGKLNNIRNALAHNLKDQLEIEGAVKSVIQSYQSKADLKLNLGMPVHMLLRNCIVKLCEFLDDVIVHFYKLDLPKYE